MPGVQEGDGDRLSEVSRNEPRAVRKRERAVAARALAGPSCIDRDDVETVTADRERKRRADGPEADDHDVMRARRHRAQAASTSATVFGVDAVRFSLPLAVTRTSSSIRTPMFHQRFGTPRVPDGM